MLQATCDLCHNQYDAGAEQGVTDGQYQSVLIGITTVRVRLEVKSMLPDKDRYADICPCCRAEAVKAALDGNTIHRHPKRRGDLRGRGDEGFRSEGEGLRSHA